MNKLAGERDSMAAEHDVEALTFTFLGAAHALEGRIEAALDQVGLSLAKHGILTELVKVGKPMPLSELAERLSCVRSNVTQMVDRLEVEKLVRRVADPDDRRSVLAELTKLGRERQAAGNAELLKVHEAFGATLADGDCAVIRRMAASLK